MTTPYSPYAPAAEPARMNVLSIVSLVAAFLLPPAGIITGHIALSQLKRTGERGHGLALAGVIVGYIAFVIGALVGILFAVAVLAAASADTTSLNSYSY